MADKTAPMLMNLPLEVRHAIFKHVAAPNLESRKLLWYWFEKKEVKALVAQYVADNPDAPTPQAVYSNHDDYANHVGCESVGDGGDGGSEDDNEQDGVGQDGEDEEDDEAEQEEDDETDEEAEADFLEYQGEPTAGEPEEEAEDVMEEDDSADTGENQFDADEDQSEDMTGDDGSADAPAQPPQATVFRPHYKWRYVLNFMRLTQCPPPVELLLTSHQLNNEAKDWFYDVAILRIDATGSFAHTSFFEEAFSQITGAAFSPMENIRKVQVTFVWDSTWIRADTTGCVGAIFPALLGQRSRFVYQILLMAPNLEEVVIHW